MEFCEYVQGIDYFGKIPEFYIKGRPKHVTLIGRIFTVIYCIIYIIIIGYEIYRMTIRVDITFYDSYSNTEDIPTILITKENFNLIFSLLDENGQPFIEERIYYPLAYFFDEDKDEMEEIKLERCSIDKIGTKYKNVFDDSVLNNYYCLNEVNYTFNAYMNSILVKIFPCKNKTENNNHCKSQDIIDKNINGRDLEINFEDILVTPLNYDNPIKEKINYLYTTVYKTFGQFLYTEMQLVEIETTTNIIGFDFLTDPKKEHFLKYNSLEIIPQPGYDLNDDTNNYPICDVNFQLNDKILSEKRQYTQLIDVLGEVGGLMQIIYSFLGFICSFVVDILYEKTIANNLFSFDINKNLIILKNEKKLLLKYNPEENEENNKIHIRNITPNTTKKIKKEKILMMDTMNNKDINDKNSENYLIRKNNNLEKKAEENEVGLDNYDIQSLKISNTKYINRKKINYYNKTTRNKIDLITNDKNSLIINTFKSKDILISFCFCFKRNKRYLNKILLKETMNIVTEKLDIFNVLRNICLIEKSKEEIKSDFGSFRMSDECIKILGDINK